MRIHIALTSATSALLAAAALFMAPATASIRHNTAAPGFPPLDPLGNKGTTLPSGGILDESHYLQSANGQHVILTDGSSGEALALLLTGPACTPTPILVHPTPTSIEYILTMQTDGNLVLSRHDNGAVVWATGTQGHPGSRIAIQNDGNYVIYTPANTPIWSSHTNCSSMTSFKAPDDSASFHHRNTVYLNPATT